METISENMAENAVEELKGKWGWLLTLGILMLILGFCALSMPFVAALASVLFLGWLLIIGGVLQGIHSFGQKHWGSLFWQLLIGILYLLIGVMLIVEPLRSLMALTLLLAIFFKSHWQGYRRGSRDILYRGKSHVLANPFKVGLKTDLRAQIADLGRGVRQRRA